MKKNYVLLLLLIISFPLFSDGITVDFNRIVIYEEIDNNISVVGEFNSSQIIQDSLNHINGEWFSGDIKIMGSEFKNARFTFKRVQTDSFVREFPDFIEEDDNNNPPFQYPIISNPTFYEMLLKKSLTSESQIQSFMNLIGQESSDQLTVDSINFELFKKNINNIKIEDLSEIIEKR